LCVVLAHGWGRSETFREPHRRRRSVRPYDVPSEGSVGCGRLWGDASGRLAARVDAGGEGPPPARRAERRRDWREEKHRHLLEDAHAGRHHTHACTRASTAHTTSNTRMAACQVPMAWVAARGLRGVAPAVGEQGEAPLRGGSFRQQLVLSSPASHRALEGVGSNLASHRLSDSLATRWRRHPGPRRISCLRGRAWRGGRVAGSGRAVGWLDGSD